MTDNRDPLGGIRILGSVRKPGVLTKTDLAVCSSQSEYITSRNGISPTFQRGRSWCGAKGGSKSLRSMSGGSRDDKKMGVVEFCAENMMKKLI